MWCIWLCKDTNLKANHNSQGNGNIGKFGVYDSAKILIWKQITTQLWYLHFLMRCIWLCKDTNLKANHNIWMVIVLSNHGVYDSAKILIWKQITTSYLWQWNFCWCIWLCKDTNLKANHNIFIHLFYLFLGVYDSAKILIWKQITTTMRGGFNLPLVYMTLQRY